MVLAGAILSKELIIFGNGLGRAIDNDFFCLDRALNVAWNDPDVLTEKQRELILRCLPTEVVEADGAPTSEDHLENLQRTLAACDLINELEDETSEGWLTEHGREFPAAIRSYLHRTACEFHMGNHMLPEDFAQELRAFVIKTKSHIATLNYDKLLYSAFVNTKVFDGYNCLIDGFISGTFSPGNMHRKTKSRTSYYLHLHGSPLYYDDNNGETHKAATAEVELIAGDRSGHIVLTNVKYKTAVIMASPLLLHYWKMFEQALDEARRITLFGYSGFDEHLNRKISISVSEKPKPIRVIEYAGPESDAERESFWRVKVGEVQLLRHKNILRFTEWDK